MFVHTQEDTSLDLGKVQAQRKLDFGKRTQPEMHPVVSVQPVGHHSGFLYHDRALSIVP
jgi:hypothetical protein